MTPSRPTSGHPPVRLPSSPSPTPSPTADAPLSVLISLAHIVVLPFHLAFPVRDLTTTRAFYSDLLGCREGRSAALWIDFDFHGHQISAHLAPDACRDTPHNEVDGDGVPVRHFGIVLDWNSWHALADRLRSRAAAFRIAPRIRFLGEVGEQATFFLDDPSGNALEFKSFRDPTRLFARE